MKRKQQPDGFGDAGLDMEDICCANCHWFFDGYPNAEDCPCMHDPPMVVIMTDLEGKEIVRTVRPTPKYPNKDFCSKFAKRTTK